jgi:hypothetical protein
MVLLVPWPGERLTALAFIGRSIEAAGGDVK